MLMIFDEEKEENEKDDDDDDNDNGDDAPGDEYFGFFLDWNYCFVKSHSQVPKWCNGV